MARGKLLSNKEKAKVQVTRTYAKNFKPISHEPSEDLRLYILPTMRSTNMKLYAMIMDAQTLYV